MNNLLKGVDEALTASKQRNNGNGSDWRVPIREMIKLLRKELSLTQAQFAEIYQLDLSSLKNWEQGRSVPERSSLQILAMIKSDPVGYRKMLSKSNDVYVA